MHLSNFLISSHFGVRLFYLAAFVAPSVVPDCYHAVADWLVGLAADEFEQLISQVSSREGCASDQRDVG